jgi:hypothetical protein
VAVAVGGTVVVVGICVGAGRAQDERMKTLVNIAAIHFFDISLPPGFFKMKSNM